MLARYNQNEDTVTWECELPNGEPYYLHWPRAEFGPSMGIKKELIPPGGIPVRLLLGDPEHDIPPFLEDIKGKEFDLVIEHVPAEDFATPLDGNTMANEARGFCESLNNRSFKPSNWETK